MRLVPHSIQGRMLLLSAVATAIALALAGALIAGVLARFVTQGIDRRLDAELALIASAVGNDGSIDRPRLARLQGALEAGPGWRWRIETPLAGFGSDDMPVADIAPPRPRREHDAGAEPVRPIDGRDARGERVHARQLRIQTSAGVVLLTAAAPRDVIERPVRDTLLPLLLTLAALGLVLGAAAWLQIRLGLRPVRRLRDAVVAIRAGGAHSIGGAQPSELRPLADELNALVRDNEAALAAARGSAANLAHALKTPVATLALALRGDPREQQVERIDRTIRHHLARARMAAASTRAATPLDAAVRALLEVIARLHADRRIAIAVDVTPHLMVAIDPADFDELLGNLLDNAMRHARSRVAVRARAEGRVARITIADDGPGIPTEDRARATQAGVRLDERSDGHGFGLAIARELATLHGGALTLDEAAGGGLAASVTVPLSRGGEGA
ncbi:sensor histidine kinase [Sphingomonas hengshuiensis]|uniref:histidine kinase n=1 Tax=Sphingomonas hengshuiensis TaxID=1609977 RepID=A0A7U4J6E2_9SPHN|nr:HAMP domain-containing sensor histidine kinase [Sphingomonas hengshuiensis]AJP71100.1 histidine kinase [Sphingomonas hengshuiensis]